LKGESSDFAKKSPDGRLWQPSGQTNPAWG
jgi:hypothetical protein